MKLKSLTKIYLITALASIVVFSGCLKDDALIDFSKVGVLVELPLAAYNPNADGDKFVSLSYVSTSTNIDHPVVVNVASPKPLDAPLDVTLKVNEAALTAYNAKHASEYVILPSNAYSIPNLKVTVPAGQRTATLTVKFNPSAITDFTKQYVIPITIADASGQKISNYNTVYYVVGVKNQYDGKYHASGVFTHPVRGPRDIDEDKDLATVNQFTVSSTIGDLGTPMTITINAANNNVTVAGNVSDTQPIMPVPGLTNTYDPATKTFHLNYQYLGGGGYRVIKENLVRL